MTLIPSAIKVLGRLERVISLSWSCGYCLDLGLISGQWWSEMTISPTLQRTDRRTRRCLCLGYSWSVVVGWSSGLAWRCVMFITAKINTFLWHSEVLSNTSLYTRLSNSSSLITIRCQSDFKIFKYLGFTYEQTSSTK